MGPRRAEDPRLLTLIVRRLDRGVGESDRRDAVVGTGVVGRPGHVDLGLLGRPRDHRVERHRDLADVLERAVGGGQHDLRRHERARASETAAVLIEDDHADVAVRVGRVLLATGDRGGRRDRGASATAASAVATAPRRIPLIIFRPSQVDRGHPTERRRGGRHRTVANPLSTIGRRALGPNGGQRAGDSRRPVLRLYTPADHEGRTRSGDVMSLPDHTTLNWGPWYRRSPFFDATLRAGCTAYDVYQHMYHPNTYGDPVEEYWALVNDVTLWDVSVERIVEITGPDATAFTNLLTCRDLTKCAVKQGKYMLVTAEDGGIVNDPVLLRVEENRWWLALADSDAGLYAMGVAVNSGHRRAGRPSGGLPRAGAGSEGQGHDARPLRRLGPRHEVLLVRRGRPRRHPGGDQPHRLDRGGRLRDLPARSEPRRRPVGAHPRRRQAARHPRDAVVGHPPDRGRHLRLGVRHRRSPTTRSRSPVSSGSSRSRTPTTSGRRRSSASDARASRASSSASSSKAIRSSSPPSTGRSRTAARRSAT